jgi:hypothetical protein
MRRGSKVTRLRHGFWAEKCELTHVAADQPFVRNELSNEGSPQWFVRAVPFSLKGTGLGQLHSQECVRV